jgi:hypothetical protein
MRTQRCIAYVFAACLVSLVAGTAMAANSNHALKGTYRISINKSCADVQAGFTGLTDPPPNPLNLFIQANGVGSTPNLYFTGVQTYDSNGNVTTTERGMLISPGPYYQGTFAAAVFEETCSWTYTVHPDGSFTQLLNSCTANDGSYTVTGAKTVGQIDGGGSVLNLSAAIPPVVETIVFTAGGSSKRVCGEVGTAVRFK